MRARRNRRVHRALHASRLRRVDHQSGSARGTLVAYLAGADRGDIDHEAAGARRRSCCEGAGAMASRLGLERPAGEVLVLVAAGLGVGASVLPSVVGTIASLGPSRSLSLDAWHDSPWAWLFTVLLASAGVSVLIGGGWASRQPSSWCWPTVLLILLIGDLSLVGSFVFPQNPGVGSASFSGLVLRHPELGQWLGASLGPGLGSYLSAFAALLATVSAVAVLSGILSGYGKTGTNAPSVGR